MHLRSLRGRLLLVSVGLISLPLAAEKYYWRLPRFILQLEPQCLRSPGVSEVCDTIQRYSPVVWLGPWVFFLVILLASFRWVARWILTPVRDLVPVIEQVGPQNLGHRVRATARRSDELTALGRALDDMMDRISAGYEGQRRFAANASHELRTPLALQRMLIEVGMADPLTAEQSELLTSQLLQANARNERLIEGLLVLSQADQGLVAHSPQQLDEIAASMIAANRGLAGETWVTLTGDLQPRVVHGDRVLLERLVRNLVHNAIKYNKPGGTVYVTVGASPALSVVNTGPTVPAGDVARLFEPFIRLSSDRIDHSGGSGLGLAIARSIVQAHDGTITAEPAERGGLRVSVGLP